MCEPEQLSHILFYLALPLIRYGPLSLVVYTVWWGVGEPLFA